MSTIIQNVRPSVNDLWVSLVLYLELMSIELVTNTVQRVRVLHTQFPNLTNVSPNVLHHYNLYQIVLCSHKHYIAIPQHVLMVGPG